MPIIGRRGRNILAAGYDGRDNEAVGPKTRRPENFLRQRPAGGVAPRSQTHKGYSSSMACAARTALPSSLCLKKRIPDHLEDTPWPSRMYLPRPPSSTLALSARLPPLALVTRAYVTVSVEKMIEKVDPVER